MEDLSLASKGRRIELYAVAELSVKKLTTLAWPGEEGNKMRQGKQLKDTGRESRGDTFPTLMCVGRSTEVKKTLEIIGLFIIKLFWSFNNNSIFVAYLNWLQYQGRISKN